jgi:hypothetical protein
MQYVMVAEPEPQKQNPYGTRDLQKGLGNLV